MTVMEPDRQPRRTATREAPQEGDGPAPREATLRGEGGAAPRGSVDQGATLEDQGDFERAVEDHRQRVYSFAYYLLRSREEAEDVAQEVLLRLFHHRHRVEARRAGAWLLRVTRNACYDLLRHRRTVNRHLTDLDDEAVVELPDRRRPGPHREAETDAFRQRLKEALDGLSEPQREVLILREIQGLAYKEIAEALDMPLNTVRVNLHRGRRQLRRRLHEDYRDATIH